MQLSNTRSAMGSFVDCVDRWLRKFGPAPMPPTVQFEVIGYAASGKTSLYLAMKDLLERRTPSGLFLQTSGDPASVIESWRNSRGQRSIAEKTGMESTLPGNTTTGFEFFGSIRTESVFRGVLNDCMGQMIERPHQFPAEYEAFVNRIPSTDVLVLVLPLSSIDNPDEFQSHCRTVHRYLWHALDIRRRKGIRQAPLVAVAGTKMDTLGDSIDQVAKRLSEMPISVFGEIPRTLREFHVPESAIFPTSFFGCGNAARIDGKHDEYSLADKKKSEAQNIDSLVYWALTAAIGRHRGLHTAPGRPAVEEVYEMLRSDLRASVPMAIGITGDLIWPEG